MDLTGENHGFSVDVISRCHFVRMDCMLEQLRVMRITVDEPEAEQIPQLCVHMQNATKRLRRQVDFLSDFGGEMEESYPPPVISIYLRRRGHLYVHSAHLVA